MDLRRNSVGSVRADFLRNSLVLAILALFACQSQAIIYWSASSGNAAGFSWRNGGSDKYLAGMSEPAFINGDTFQFNPASFTATSSGGIPAAKSDTVYIDIIADTVIEGIKVTETGLYNITGTGSVRASGSVKVINLSQYAELTKKFETQPTMPITAGTGSWSGGTTISDIGWSYIRVIITNSLVATSTGTNSTAFINKSETTPGQGAMNVQIIIPEPATLAIFAMGILVFPLTKKYRKQLALFVICVWGFAFTNSAHAAVAWDVPDGYNTCIQWENGQSTHGLFGEPVVDQSCTFIFAPTDFIASAPGSSDGIGDTLIFDVIVQPGYVITAVGAIESGEFVIMGNGVVNVSGCLTITNLINNTVLPVVNIGITPDMPATTEDYVCWSGSAAVGDLKFTHIRIMVSNLLTAIADDTSASLIWKTAFAVPVTVQPIPEPATVALLAFGSLAFVVKKK